MADATIRICVGVVAGTFGLSGEVRVKSFCELAESIADYAPLHTENGDRSFDIQISGTSRHALIAKLSGIDSREEAKELNGTRLYADRCKFPSPAEDEFYVADLLGLHAKGLEGGPIGKVTAVHNHGAGDILEVSPLGNKSSFLVPFSKEAVTEIDFDSKTVVIAAEYELGEG